MGAYKTLTQVSSFSDNEIPFFNFLVTNFLEKRMVGSLTGVVAF